MIGIAIHLVGGAGGVSSFPKLFQIPHHQNPPQQDEDEYKRTNNHYYIIPTIIITNPT